MRARSLWTACGALPIERGMSTLSAAPAQIPLGPSGLSCSPIGWGMWRLQGEPEAALRLAQAALEGGFTLFDTADVYGFDTGGFGAAEALFGQVLRLQPALREAIVLASKGGVALPTPYNASQAYLIHACEASLGRLGTDRIDLYQVHRPDLLAHPAEVAAALDTLRTAGKIRAAGVSNHTAAQTAALQAHLPFPLASVQPELSPLAPAALEDGVLDQAMERGMAVLAWSPLGGGRLAAPAAEDARARAVASVLDPIAQREGASRTAAALAWLMLHPARPIPLVGSQNPVRLQEAAAALHVRMTRREWYEVLVAGRGAPMP